MTHSPQHRLAVPSLPGRSPRASSGLGGARKTTSRCRHLPALRARGGVGVPSRSVEELWGAKNGGRAEQAAGEAPEWAKGKSASEGRTARARGRQSLRPTTLQTVPRRATSGRSRHRSVSAVGVVAAQAERAGETWRRGVGRRLRRSRRVASRHASGSSARKPEDSQVEGRERSGGRQERRGKRSAAKGRRSAARMVGVRRRGLLSCSARLACRARGETGSSIVGLMRKQRRVERVAGRRSPLLRPSLPFHTAPAHTRAVPAPASASARPVRPPGPQSSESGASGASRR